MCPQNYRAGGCQVLPSKLFVAASAADVHQGVAPCAEALLALITTLLHVHCVSQEHRWLPRPMMPSHSSELELAMSQLQSEAVTHWCTQNISRLNVRSAWHVTTTQPLCCFDAYIQICINQDSGFKDVPASLTAVSRGPVAKILHTARNDLHCLPRRHMELRR